MIKYAIYAQIKAAPLDCFITMCRKSYIVRHYQFSILPPFHPVEEVKINSANKSIEYRVYP